MFTLIDDVILSAEILGQTILKFRKLKLQPVKTDFLEADAKYISIVKKQE